MNDSTQFSLMRWLNKSDLAHRGRVFVIAEMSGNHNQSIARALEIVDAAADAGVDALKIQTYTANTMTLDLTSEDFEVTDKKSLWAGKSLYKLYEEAHTPWEWHRAIFDRCRERGILGFSTPFDATAVEFLESLDVPIYKIASFENTDVQLIKRVAETGKPMIISTGMASVAELDETVKVARDAGCHELVLLKCTSAYPATPADCNIATIPHLRLLFGTEVGISDHTAGIGVAIAAVALGATVIEKHFTLSRADGGVDSAFSLEPLELRALVEEARRAAQAIGKVSYGVSASEEASRTFRRSLYITAEMKPGDTFTADNVRSIRPGFGLPTKYLDQFLGKQTKRLLKRGTPLSWDCLE